MNWDRFETIYLNAWKGVFSKRRLLLVFSVLSLCGMLFVSGRVLALGSSAWIGLSLLFLPFFVSSSLVFVLGVLLVRMYVQDKRGAAVATTGVFAGSVTTAIGASFVSFPLIFGYLCLWIALGLFFLLKEIPYLGPFLNVILAFGPFLLIVGVLTLCLVNISLLFFVAPVAAHQSMKGIDFLIRIGASIRAKPLLSASLFLMGLLPVLFVGGVLFIALVLTDLSFSSTTSAIALAFQWFFVMFPCSFLLSPAVLFFFHFAAESYQLLQDRGP